MAYTLGVLENAMKQILDRINAHRATGERLVDIKSVIVGSRALEAGTDQFPRIIINLVSLTDQTVTMAYSAGQKTATLTLEIRIIAEKIKDSSDNKYATNVLFDSTGKGVLAYFQWLCDALVLTASDTYTPELGLALDIFPDARFNSIQEDEKTIELAVEFDFAIRYTMGAMGGTIS